MPCDECFDDGCSELTCPCDCHDAGVPKSIAKFYAVRNDKGQHYRTYKRRNSASGWDDMLENASVYSRIGPARSLVTRLLDCDKKSNPKLIEFVVTEVNVIARETKKGKH